MEPSWRETPNGDEVSAVYPRVANMLELTGRAEMACVAEPDGSVDQCRVTSEAPAGLGFGAAALRLAPLFKMRPKTVDGVAVRRKVTVPIRFSMTRSTLSRAPDLVAPSDPEKLALAREILTLSRTEETRRVETLKSITDQVNAAVSAGDERPSSEVVHAIQLGAQEAVEDLLTRTAHRLADSMSLADLQATRDFLRTPAAKAWLAAAAPKHAEDRKESGRVMMRAARASLCARIDCLEASTPAP